MGLTSGSAKPIIQSVYINGEADSLKSKISEEIQNHAGTPTANPITLLLSVANPSIWAPPSYDSQPGFSTQRSIGPRFLQSGTTVTIEEEAAILEEDCLFMHR